jgi:hypothetical protein
LSAKYLSPWTGSTETANVVLCIKGDTSLIHNWTAFPQNLDKCSTLEAPNQLDAHVFTTCSISAFTNAPGQQQLPTSMQLDVIITLFFLAVNSA